MRLLFSYKLIVLQFIFLVTSFVAGAQTETKLPYVYREKLQKADEYFSLLKYKEAIELYKEVLAKAGEDTSLLYKIGNSYRLSGDARNAEDWYRNVIVTHESTVNPVYKLQFAQVLTVNGKYEEALYWFRAYYKVSGTDKRAEEAINSLEHMSNLYYDTTFYVTYPVSVNTQYNEFSPAFYKGGIVFLSDRTNSKSGLYTWLYARIDSAGNISKPVKLNNGIKTEYNAGPVSFFNNDQELVFSQNYSAGKLSKKEINEIPLQLFSAKQDNEGKWKELQVLPFVSPGNSYTQPSVTSDGKTIYFASNMVGGAGGSDIYKSSFTDGKWTAPENLGPKVNTPGEEMFPFVFQDSILYFSSDGHGGLGGLDIFRINLKNGRPPENLGIPVNSPNDDFGIVLDKDGLSGYFASDRSNGSGADDMYGFKVIRITLTIKIIDRNTALPVSNAEIYSMDSNNEKLGTTDQDGSCTIVVPVRKSFQVKVKKENYEVTVYTFESVKSVKNTLAVIPILTENKPKEEKIVLTDEHNKPIDTTKKITYKVQIFASRIPVTSRELRNKYKGSMQIKDFYEDRWYKYSLGEYGSYADAKKCLYSCNVLDAFIIAFADSKKVHITVAKAATNETAIPSPIKRDVSRKP